MTSYVLAWSIIIVAGLCGMWLVLVALRRWPRLRLLAAGLVLVWALTPYRFDGEHLAPASVVALFRLLFEENEPSNAPFALLTAVTLGVVAAYLMLLAGWGVFAAAQKSRNRRLKTG